MGRLRTALLLATGLALGAGRADAQALRLEGPIPGNDELSGAAFVGDDVLVVGSDETRHVVVLRRSGDDGVWQVVAPVELLPGAGDPDEADDEEIDLEAIAVSGERVFVAGSHARKRRKAKDEKSLAENRARIQQVVREDSRHHLFSFSLAPGAAQPVEATTLDPALLADPILSRFTQVPGKENGVDVEGLAADGDTLWVGFRSPVLSGGFVPVMRTTFADPSAYELRFVDLGGRGIRDMAHTPHGLLLLAGPPAGPGPYAIFLWDGSDGLPGGGPPARELLELPPRRSGHPEALAVMSADGACYRVLLLHDGVARGAPEVRDVCVGD